MVMVVSVPFPFPMMSPTGIIPPVPVVARPVIAPIIGPVVIIRRIRIAISRGIRIDRSVVSGIRPRIRISGRGFVIGDQLVPVQSPM